MMKHKYDFNYFERGIEAGISGYQNYRWLPELTTGLAMAYIDHLGVTPEHSVLDFGCAKGYVVKALRILHRQAWGCDISEYAVNSADNDTRQFLRVSVNNIIPYNRDFNFIVSKDVFEHIPESEIDEVLDALRQKGTKMFAVVPLGRNNRYIVPAYELDVTHVLAKDEEWWINRFGLNGWTLENFSYRVPGVKESWSNFEKGNGFFTLI